MPAFAYVPGQTARHPEGAFDAIRESVHAGMAEADLAESEAFKTGLRYLRDGFYWEAHEVLEPVWMACRPNGQARAVVQGLIQTANARLKLKMNKPRAAVRLFGIAQRHLADAGNEAVLGLSIGPLQRDIEMALNDLRMHYNA